MEPTSAEEQEAQIRRISAMDKERPATNTHEKTDDNHSIRTQTVASVEDDEFDASSTRKGLKNRLKAVVSSSKG